MITANDLQNMEGRPAVDTNGAKLGKIGQVYVDDRTSQPLWVTIKTGMFGMKESFAPLHGSRSDGESLRLAVTKDMVKDAPSVEADGSVEGDENEALYNYYEGYLGNAQDAPAQYEGHGYAGGSSADRSGRDSIRGTSGPTTGDAMARSEERLPVGTENTEFGRARLRKYAVIGNVTQAVPVSHEEGRLDQDPDTTR